MYFSWCRINTLIKSYLGNRSKLAHFQRYYEKIPHNPWQNTCGNVSIYLDCIDQIGFVVFFVRQNNPPWTFFFRSTLTEKENFEVFLIKKFQAIFFLKRMVVFFSLFSKTRFNRGNYRLSLCTMRPKSPPHTVNLTYILCTKQEFLIDDDMIPYPCAAQIRESYHFLSNSFYIVHKTYQNNRVRQTFWSYSTSRDHRVYHHAVATGFNRINKLTSAHPQISFHNI